MLSLAFAKNNIRSSKSYCFIYFFHEKTIEPIRFHVAIDSLLHTHVNARVFTCSNVA